MKIQNKKILASILFVIISFVCVAQDVNPPQPNDGPIFPVGLPIDGFTTMALVVGAYLGIKKTINNTKD